MTHYTVLVCLSEDDEIRRARNIEFGGAVGAVKAAVEHKLEQALAPFDENLAVTPYREYEEDKPEDFWLYSSLRQADEDERNGTGLLPYQPDALGWLSSSKETPDEQRLAIAKKAALFRTLPEPVTWDALFDAHAILYPGETIDRTVDDDGRAYRMSTYNSSAKWDWYSVGGRWGGYLLRKPESDGATVILAERSWSSPDHFDFYSCDAAPKGLVDLEAMRAKSERKARERWQQFHAIADRFPGTKSWAYFRGLLDVELTIDEARDGYRAQPGVQALRDTDFAWADDPYADYGVPEDEYAEDARASAVPGFALLTTDGRWIEPGQMGWFATSSDTPESRENYRKFANAYIESLPDDSWLVAVDVHI